MKSAIVLAAGKGTRMNSKLPKVLHKVCSKPMIEHIVDNLKTCGVERIVTVVGHGAEIVEEAMAGRCEFALQSPQLGSGHAVMCASALEHEKGKTLVVNGDCPCIQKETYQKMLDALNDCGAAVLTVSLKDPKAYGRIIRDETGKVLKIVEYKDADEEERKVYEINTGIYCFDNELLFEGLKELKNDNAQHEYYITDLIEIFNRKNIAVKAVLAEDPGEVAGINDRIELAEANAWMQDKINQDWMKKGVTILDPKSTYIGKDVEIGQDTVIYPNCHLEGNTVIGENTTLLPNCFLINAKIGNNCTIDSSRITDSEVKNSCTVGPWAHLRMNCVVEDKNRIGNFVEFKNTKFGFDSRCAHLTYLGDSEIGKGVNIGCGVVTVNYDGLNKYKTVVRDNAFIGSNANLIAPITIGANAVVAAGSTVNQDVEDGDMAIARKRQEVKKGFGAKYTSKKKKQG